MSTDPNIYQPDWQPKDAGSEYACFVTKGVNDTGAPTAAAAQPARRTLSIDDYVEGIRSGDRIVAIGQQRIDKVDMRQATTTQLFNLDPQGTEITFINGRTGKEEKTTITMK